MLLDIADNILLQTTCESLARCTGTIVSHPFHGATLCCLLLFCYCLSNAIHCMGQNVKSLVAFVGVCVLVCARVLGLNISKKVTDRGSVTMGH